MQPGNHDLPEPFLTREGTDDRLRTLGFKFTENLGYLLHGQEEQFQALQELIAGAIAEWSDARPEGGKETWGQFREELNTFAQEYLIG